MVKLIAQCADIGQCNTLIRVLRKNKIYSKCMSKDVQVQIECSETEVPDVHEIINERGDFSEICITVKPETKPRRRQQIHN